MSEEIKEILDKLKDDRQMCSHCYYRIFKEDRDKILDYITNLQKQLKYLRNGEYLNQVKWERDFNEKLVKDLQQENENYKSKIEKIIKLTEPFVEWGECTINGKILKRIYDIAKGE